MLIKIAVVAFLTGLMLWYLWAAYSDFRRGRVPVASTLVKLHYATRANAPAIFWGVTLLRAAFGVILVLRISAVVANLLAS
jgi:hypothetical protein